MAVALAAKPLEWTHFWEALQTDDDDPIDLVIQAVALGWKSKWT